VPPAPAGVLYRYNRKSADLDDVYDVKYTVYVYMLKTISTCMKNTIIFAFQLCALN
jgi:hypothetical protein